MADSATIIAVLRATMRSELAHYGLPPDALIEDDSPRTHTDDYRVVFEATVAPTSLDQLRLALVVTAEGACGVGLEQCGRVARRLGVTTANPVGFVAGHEPIRCSDTYIRNVIAAVAAGRIAMEVRTALGHLRAVALHPTANHAGEASAIARLRPRFTVYERVPIPFVDRVSDLTYRPWSESA